MDTAAYLARISYNGPTEPTLENLRAVHQAHLLAVPFENLDIHLGRPILLDEAAFFAKIVEERRGGFCYELNGLFAALLRRLGYRVSYLSARVINREGIVGPEFDHLALRIDLDKAYLVDVGFGNGFREPLELAEWTAQRQGNLWYRLAPVDEIGNEWRLDQREAGGDWEKCYLFSLKPYQLQDFDQMCQYQQTSPLSGFTRRRVAIRLLPEGQIRLRDMQLVVEKFNQKEERLLESQEEYFTTLRELFGLDLVNG